MSKRIVLIAFVLMLLSMFGARLVITAGGSTTHHVYPGDSIQDAINSAQSGDTIFVHNGTYIGNVVVNKTVSLVGENKHNTIIDGNGGGTVVEITANNVNISKFTIQNGFWGIDLDGSNNIVSNNNVVSNQRVGILLGGSNSTLRNNNITGSQLNLYLDSWATGKRFYHDIDSSNTVDGKPIYYLVNQHNQQIPQEAGYVAAVNCTNITIRNLNLQKNIHGVFFVNTTRSTVENVTVLDTVYGIFLRDSSNNTIYKNTVLGLSEMQDGIRLEGSGNNVSFNTLTVENGIGVYIYRHSGNTVSNNFFRGCGGGIRLDYSKNNIIYHNNFIDNWIYQAILYPEPYNNTWDDGYPSGGNYWSDYTGVDLCSGPYQNETGSDAMGDTPYVIDANNQDNYPLMNPWIPEYTFTIYSSPTGVTFTVDAISPTAPWSGTYTEGTSASLVMPEIHTVGEAKYYWNQWSDGDTSRSRTVTMNANITLTAYYTGPYYQLNVTSSPITGVTFTVNGGLQTTPYTEWLLEGSYTLVIPETYDGYIWSHWLEDGDTNRTKTITLGGATWTAVYSQAAPPIWMRWWLWIIVAVGIIALAGAVYFLRKRKPPTPIASPLPSQDTLQNINLLTVFIAIYKPRPLKSPIC